MENYDLEEDEVVLYKGAISRKKENGTTELVLTNYNFVIISKEKPLFQKEKVAVDVYPVNEIKWYKGVPQVIKKGNLIELYLFHDEVEFSFDSSGEARKFMSAALTLLTNKTTLERGAEKVKSTISQVDNSLGINSVEMASGAIKNGTMGKTLGFLGKGAQVIGSIIKKKK